MELTALGGMEVLFLFILLMCVCHYAFFLLLNTVHRPVTTHKFFAYDDRVEYVSSCFHREGASVCGSVPEELRDRVTGSRSGWGGCGAGRGVRVGRKFFPQETDFEALEAWCLRSP